MIPVFKPSYDSKEAKAVADVLKTGWVGLGPKTQEFETKFASYLGAKYAIGLNSCSAALHLAFKVLDIPKDSEVITTSMTFISSNHAIIQNGLTPVFCDIEHDTLNIDAEKIEALITPKTKAILCVHYGGHSCNMKKIKQIAKKYKLFVVEDCAHAAGGEFEGKKLGTIGDIGCFSFHAVKNLATGQGGMMVTENKKWAERLKKLRWMGINKDTWKRSEIGNHYSWYYTVEEVGYLYYMFDIQAAIGLVQLKKLDKLNARRKKISDTYSKSFKNCKNIEIPVNKEYTKNSHHNYVIKTKKRDSLQNYLSKKGIATSVHYYPNHMYDLYKQYYRELPVLEQRWKEVLTLPLFPDMSQKEIKNVVDNILKWDAAS